jgi:hypothetical protein
MRTRVVRTLADFVSAVEDVRKGWHTKTRTTPLWFRGQPDSSWSLMPGIYRGKVDHELEREITRDFHLFSKQFPEAVVNTDLERMFVMQHFGLPTRLLDWTESYLTALYFAVLAHESRTDAAVFVLDPWRLNERSIGQITVPTIDHPSVAPYALGDPHQNIQRTLAAKDPIAVRPPHGTARIRAQNGFFTIHGHDQRPLDELSFSGLWKIVIAGGSKTVLLRELVRAGVSPKTVFPDLSGVCEDIALRYSKGFMLDQPARRRTALKRPPNTKAKPTSRKRVSRRRPHRIVTSAIPRKLGPEGFGPPPKPIKIERLKRT